MSTKAVAFHAFHAQSAKESRATIAKRPGLEDPEARNPRVIEIAVRDDGELAEVQALLDEAMPKLRQERQRYRDVLERMLPPDDAVLARGTAAQAQRNADLQTVIAREFGLLSSAEVAQQAASGARNQAATANRWRSADKIFAVSWRSATVYPGFQFDEDGKPLAVLGEILPTLQAQLTGWEIAGWLTACRDELDGARPVDVWRERPDAVHRLVHTLLVERDTKDV